MQTNKSYQEKWAEKQYKEKELETAISTVLFLIAGLVVLILWLQGKI